MDTWNVEPISLPPVEPPETGSPHIEEPGRRWWIWLVYALLFGASVPWYLPQDNTPPIWLGLPQWVVMSLMATIGIAIFTAFVVHRYWPKAEPLTTLSEEKEKPS
jgi:hypothetical protein